MKILSKLNIFLIVLFTSIFLLVLAYFFYQTETKEIVKDKHEFLHAVSNLKLEQVLKWKKERTGDAKFFPTIGQFIKYTDYLLINKNDAEANQYFSKTLKQFVLNGYDENIIIADTSGKILFSLDKKIKEFDSNRLAEIKVCITRDSVAFGDFYFSGSSNDIRLNLLSIIKNNDGVPIGTFIQQIDPNKSLFSIIQKWPVLSKSAETLFYKTESDSVVFLNNLRHKKNTALTLKIPITKDNVVAVKGVLGKRGVVEGIDYRGVEVLAELNTIPGTDWYMVSKVDKEEIFSEIFFRAEVVIILLLISILFLTSVALYYYKLQQSRIYKNLFLKQKELAETQEEYKTALYSIGDGVITTNTYGTVKQMNPIAENLTGWKEREAKGLLLSKIFNIVNEETGKPVQNPVDRVLKDGVIVGLANHTMLISKNGNKIPIADSGSPIKNDEDKIIGVVLVFRDQTEERSKEKIITESEERFRKAFTTSPDAVNINRLSDGMYVSVNSGFLKMTGYSEEEVIGKTSYEINIWADIKEREKLVAGLKSTGIVENLEARFRLKNGQFKDGLMSATVLDLNGEKHILSITRDITEIKQTQEIIKNSEANLNSLINNRNESIWSIDENYNYVVFNNIFKKSYFETYNIELKNGLSAIDILTPELKEFWKPKYDAALKGEKLEFEFFTDENNKANYFQIFLNPIISDGIINGVSALSVDITELKRTEEALVKSEERLRLSLKAANQGLYDLNIQTGEAIVSDEYALMLGYDPKTFKETNSFWIDRLHPDDKDITTKAFLDYINGNTSDYRVEFRQKTKDNKWKWMLSLGKIVEQDNDKKPLRMLGTHTDINTVKLAEEKFRSIWENSVDAMRLVDSNGVIINVNNSYCKLFGLKKEELIDKSFNVSYLIRDEDTSLTGFTERFNTRTIQKKFETEIELKDNSLIWIELTNSFIEYEDKDALLLSIIRDITDRKNLINQLTDAKTKAEEMNRLKAFFFANMSHELRTPFVGIMGFSEILSKTLQNEEEKNMARQILKSSKRLTDTLNKILNVTRLEFDRIDLINKEFDVCQLLKNTQLLYSNSAKLNNTVITVTPENEKLPFKSDQRLLEEILNNLVSNAVKFTESGTIQISAQKEIDVDKENLIIRVKDNGIGIPKDKQHLVWYEFRQVSEGLNRSFEGTGLGLTITKRYVEILGGKITLESEVNAGSTFTIILPINDVDIRTEVESAKTTIPIKQTFQNPDNKKYKVLYVEDDIIALNYISIVLRNNYDVTTAFSAKIALELVNKAQFDILMLDINLGKGMDGIELMQKIKQIDYYKNIPVVAVTAYAAQADKEEFLSKGFSHYISKPFTSKELKGLLSSIFISSYNQS